MKQRSGPDKAPAESPSWRGDTKGRDLFLLKELLLEQGAGAIIIDLSTQRYASRADITPKDVAGHHPNGADIFKDVSRCFGC